MVASLDELVALLDREQYRPVVAPMVQAPDVMAGFKERGPGAAAARAEGAGSLEWLTAQSDPVSPTVSSAAGSASSRSSGMARPLRTEKP